MLSRSKTSATAASLSKSYIDATRADETTIRDLVKGETPIKFDWENRWLKGEEYAHLLNHRRAYERAFGMIEFTPKTHPESIYNDP